MNKSLRWKLIVAFVLIFLAGAACGFFGAVHMHEYRLYILEGTVPAGGVPPALFQQSLGFIDKDGNRVEYKGKKYLQPFGFPK